MLKAILFDLDGTLTHTDAIHFFVWQSLLPKYGINIDLSFYQQHISGRSNPNFLSKWLPELSSQEILTISNNKEARFRELAQEKLEPLPGLEKLLEWIKTHSLKKGVVTNAPRPNADFMLKALKLDKYWDTVVVSEELPWTKPHPFPYQEALRRLNITAEEALVFEDSPSGVQSAVGAGLFTVGITTTQGEETLRTNGAKLVISDFKDPQLTTIGLLV